MNSAISAALTGVGEFQTLAFAERGVEAVVAERGQPVETGERDVALDGGELEGQRRRARGSALAAHAARIPRHRSSRRPARRGRAISVVERDGRERRSSRPSAGPSQPGAPRAASMKRCEAVETVGLARLTCSVTSPGRSLTARLNERHLRIAAIAQLQPAEGGGLRLDGDDARAERAESADAVADMRADVEDQIAVGDELPVERDHAVAACAGCRNRSAESGRCPLLRAETAASAGIWRGRRPCA